MVSILVLSTSLLGVGICSALERKAGWEVDHLRAWDPEAIAEQVRLAPPAVTILDATSGDVVHLFDQIGRQRVQSLGMLVVVTNMARDEETLFRLAIWGVAAYLGSAISLEDFVTTVQRVSTGEYLLSEDSLDQGSPCLSRRSMYRAPHVAESVSPLTTRETEVLCLTKSMLNKEIARTLKIDEQTVRNHLRSCFKKLGVRNRTAAVVAAWKHGWITLLVDAIPSEGTLAPVA